MSHKPSGRHRRSLNFWPVWLFLAYIVFVALNRYTPGYVECITASWCLSSRGDGWLLSLIQLAFLILVAVAARFAFVWAIRMLASPRRHWWLLAFFTALGLLAIAAWIATVPRAQWGAFAHVPAIAALSLALGVAMYFGFRPRPPRRPTERR
jgi:hypothetical protein